MAVTRDKILFALAFAFALTRIFFGVDFTDEAYALATPLSFALGNPPFTVEILPHQTAGILLLPFIKLFLALTPDNDGIVLAFRFLYLASAVGTTVAVALGLRRMQLPVWPAAIVLIAFPFGHTALTYNLIAMFGLTAATFLALAGERHAWMAGALLAIASFAYPTMAVAAFLFVALAFFFLTREAAIRVGMSAAGFGLLLGLVLGLYGVGNFLDSIRTSMSLNIYAGGLPKLETITRAVLGEFETLLKNPFILALILFALVPRLRRIRLAWPSLIFAASAWLILDLAPYGSLRVIVRFALGGLIVLVLARRMERRWIPLVIASVTGGLLTAFTSDNGWTNAGLGLLPVCIFVIAKAEEFYDGFRQIRRALAVAWPTLVCATLVWICSQNIYREPSILQLSERVDSGPYAGLFTSKLKAGYELEARGLLLSHVNLIDKPQTTLLVLDQFPAGYLFTRARPLTRAVWILSMQNYPIPRELFVDFHVNPKYRPTFVLWPRFLFTDTPTPAPFEFEDEPLREFLRTLPSQFIGRRYFDLQVINP